MTATDRDRIQRGWHVVGSDGGDVGEVEQVRDDMLIVKHDRLLRPDERLYIPVDALGDVRSDTVALNIAASQIGAQGWHVQPGSPPPRPVGLDGDDDGGDMTTMTGAGYGAGGTPAAAGPLEPTRGHQIEGRFGGSGRAGLGSPRLDDDEEVAPESLDGRPPRRPDENTGR